MPSTQQGFLIRGAGTSQPNGAYYPDAHATQREGWSRPYRQDGGDGTIEYKDDLCWWYLGERYGRGCYYCVSTSAAPPPTRWPASTGHGAWPPPSITPTSRTAEEAEVAERRRRA